jgi:glycosyltransferase involved in cell wall biosynthesis
VAAICTKIYVLPLTPLQITGNILASVSRNLPIQVAYFYNKTIHSQIRTILQTENPQHIYCQLIRMALYAENAPVPCTLDYMDNFSINTFRRAKQANWLTRLFWQREARMTADFETQAFNWFRQSTIISTQDRELLPFEQRKRVVIIPNGVDTNFFAPDPTAIKKYDLAFVGNMGYKPNVEAAKYLVEQIMPLVWQTRPSTSLLIAGARPTNEVQRLENQHVTISGWIDDIRNAYRETNLLVAPLFTGSGQQNKILESMAMGVPCITTTLVNNAIGAAPYKEVLIADDAAAFAKIIVETLAQKNLQIAIAENALVFVRKQFSWQHYGEQLSALFIPV